MKSLPVAAVMAAFALACFLPIDACLAQTNDNAPVPGSSSSPGLPNFSDLRGGAPARDIDRSIRESTTKPTVNSAADAPATGDVNASSPGYNPAKQPFQPAYIPVNPPVQSGLTPRQNAPKSKVPFPGGLTPRFQPRPPISPQDTQTLMELESIADQATKSSGAIFQDADNVIVKPPLLTALITLEKRRSPYDLDADSSSRVTLRDLLKTALESNLAIKIANQDVLENKWATVGAFSGFLPNVGNEINFEGLGGNYVTPAGFAIPIKNGFLTMNSGYDWTLFKGGGIIHTYRQTKHNYKASIAAAKGTTNDVLDEVTNNFYNLVLNEVMLQIKVKQVQVCNALVLVDKDLYTNGVNTQLDVLQAQYQLSTARQQLIQQQVSRREAAVKLATSINLDPEVDLTPRDRLVSKIQLVDSRLTPGDLLKIAIDNRPELKRYDELRLAAKEQLKVAKSTLSPVISTQGKIIGSAARATSIANGSSATGLSAAGAGVGVADSVATLPLTNASVLGPKSFTSRSLFIMAIDMQWNLGGLGLKETSQIQAASADARKASLEFNRALAGVYQQVRDAYLSSLSAENLIVETTDTVNYGAEELRVAEIRLKDGIGTSTDVINAERDYINALSSKANAIIQYNVSQASLLHAMGRLSLDTLTSNMPIRQ